MISGGDQFPPGGQPGGGEDDQPHGGGLGQQGLIPPLPGGLAQSPQQLIRQIGWTALTKVVTSSAAAPPTNLGGASSASAGLASIPEKPTRAVPEPPTNRE